MKNQLEHKTHRHKKWKHIGSMRTTGRYCHDIIYNLYFSPGERIFICLQSSPRVDNKNKVSYFVPVYSVTGGELFEDIVAREYYSEADARYSMSSYNCEHVLWWIVFGGYQTSDWRLDKLQDR